MNLNFKSTFALGAMLAGIYSFAASPSILEENALNFSLNGPQLYNGKIQIHSEKLQVADLAPARLGDLEKLAETPIDKSATQVIVSKAVLMTPKPLSFFLNGSYQDPAFLKQAGMLSDVKRLSGNTRESTYAVTKNVVKNVHWLATVRHYQKADLTSENQDPRIRVALGLLRDFDPELGTPDAMTIQENKNFDLVFRSVMQVTRYHARGDQVLVVTYQLIFVKEGSIQFAADLGLLSFDLVKKLEQEIRKQMIGLSKVLAKSS